jgi:hypothetical protein
LERLDRLAQKFKRKADIHEEWSRGKEEVLSVNDYRNATLSEVRVSLADFSFFSTSFVILNLRCFFKFSHLIGLEKKT